MIAAGKMRRRVTIQKPTETNTDGRVAKTWSDVNTVWAEFVDTRAKEFLNAKQVNAKLTHLLRIRWRDDVIPKWRLTHGSSTLNILGVVNPGQRREELLLECEELVTT